jgi:hypothetical protein
LFAGNGKAEAGDEQPVGGDDEVVEKVERHRKEQTTRGVA